VLRDLPLPSHERIITSWGSGEDAALWTIDQERAGILTVDFITPVSDDPRTWGQIAATNSLSDVFAMGGKPFVALNIVGFPTKTLELDVLKDVLRGGQEKVAEAGAFLLGGHSVDDQEPKYGLVVYGEVRQDSLWKVTGARPGDLLLLTKPVGTGIIATAVKADMVEDEASRTEAARWMTTLNDLPRRLSPDECRMVHACTDVTGFGLAGHVLDMLSEGGLKLTLGIRDIPLLPGVLDLASSGLIPAGTYSNRIAYEDRVKDPSKHDDILMDMVFDAQTSGGLLLALGREDAERLLPKIRNSGFDRTAVIGRFSEGDGTIEIADAL
jgi:selenide,water dikinase